MARRKSQWLWAVFVVGFVLLLPVILPVALVWHGVNHYRIRRAAKRFQCVGCGNILGSESIRLADGFFANQMKELRRKHPGVKFRTVRSFDAQCGKCGKRYKLQAIDWSFVEVAPADSAEPCVLSTYHE